MTAFAQGRSAALRWILPLAVLAIFAAQVVAIAMLSPQSGAQGSSALATSILGARIARYLGFCPLPFVVYFLALAVTRVPLFLVVAAVVRRACRGAAGRTRRGVIMTLAAALLVWGALAFGGAGVLGLVAAADARELRWAAELGKVTFLAGLPCWTLALTGAVTIRRGLWFWLVTTPLLLVFTLLSFGLRGEQLPAWLPGIIDLGLLSGVETWRVRAVVGAVAWPLGGAALAAALGPRLKAEHMPALTATST